MSARYLLDTSVLSHLIRDPHGPVARRVAAAGDAAVFTSSVVACELRFGALKRGSSQISERVDALLQDIEVAALDGDVDRQYAEIRLALEAKDLPIGGNDLLIAAHARHLAAVLVTDNEVEFQRVPDLDVENWVRAN